jgi:hypothetical protein
MGDTYSLIFYWIGVSVVAGLLGAAVVILCAAVVIAVMSFAPRVHFGPPKTEMVVSTYDKNVTTGEGRKVKVAEDLQITRICGFSWGVKLVFGLMLFRPDTHT